MKPLQTSFVYAVLSLLLGTLITGFLSCAHREQPVLQRADELLSTDSAERAAALLDSVQKEVATWNKADRMRHALLSAEAQNKRFIAFTDDSLLLAVVDYYEKEGTPFDQMRAYYVMGSVYRDLQWSTQAQAYLHKAIEVADTSKLEQMSLLARIYGQLGESYSAYGNSTKIKEIFKKQVHYGFKSKDSLIAIAGLLRLGHLYKYDSLILYSKMAEQLYCSSTLKKYRANAMLSQVLGYINLEDFNRADSLFKEIDKEISNSNDTIEGYYHQILKRYYVQKGNFFMKQNMPDSAIRCYRKELGFSDIIFKRGAYDNLKNAYRKKGIADSVVKYQRLYIRELRKKYGLDNQKQTELFEQLHSNAERQRTMLEIKNDLYRSRVTNISILFACILLIVFVLFFSFMQIRNRRKKLLDLTKEYNIAINNINENTKQINALESDKNSLEKFVLSLRLKNEELENQKIKIEKQYNRIRKNEENISKAVYLQEIKNIKDIYATTKDFSHDLRQKLFDTIIVAHPKLTAFINDNKALMSEEEYQICFLVAAGFRPQEIADIMFMSKQNVSSIRSRLYKKIFKQEVGTSRDFDKRIGELL